MNRRAEQGRGLNIEAWAEEQLQPHRLAARCRSSRRRRRIVADRHAVLAHDGRDSVARLLFADIILSGRPPGRRTLAWARQVLHDNPGCALAASSVHRGRLTVVTRDGGLVRVRSRHAAGARFADTTMRLLHTWWATRTADTMLLALHVPAPDVGCQTHAGGRLRIRHTLLPGPYPLRGDNSSDPGGRR